MRKFQVLEVAITKLQQGKWLKDRDGFVFVVKVLEPLLSAGDVTDKGHALWLDGNVGYIIQKRLTNSDSNANVFSKNLRATFVEWSH